MARVTAVLADVFVSLDRLDDAIGLLERALADLAEPDAERAAALHEVSRMYFLRGDLDDALARTEEALAIAEPRQNWELIANSLMSRGTTLTFYSRLEEGSRCSSGVFSWRGSTTFRTSRCAPTTTSG